MTKQVCFLACSHRLHPQLSNFEIDRSNPLHNSGKVSIPIRK